MGRTAKDIGGLVKDLIAIEDIETKKGFIRKYQALPIRKGFIRPPFTIFTWPGVKLALAVSPFRR